ncbi:c-type cytochrome [Pelagivirga sediminicola]|nr:c-type cytochrome [Pelagivirga sediminicola]
MAIRTRTILASIGALAVVVAGGLAWMAAPPALEDKSPGFTGAADLALIERGSYIARLGDCVACHTEEGGAEMAGGRALETPFGIMRATNITPDPKTGIGDWSFAEFDRAMRKGIAKDNHHLYPAMPYPSYARMTDEDMTALWAYMSQGVQPVEKANMPNGIGFPFNQRWGIGLWNAVFLQDEQFTPDPAQSDEWNRGAYLVQGPGHCGACHTPRGIGFQEVAMDETGRAGDRFLAGSVVEEWNAVNIRNLWTPDHMVQLLRTGQNNVSSAVGAMADVIEHSTQYFTDEDLMAMAVYMDSLPTDDVRPDLPPPEPGRDPAPVPETLFTTAGGLGYAQFCADCHRNDGQGVPGVFPPLSGNHVLSAEDPATLTHITLTGWKSVATDARPRSFYMPSFARLTDAELAEILTFVRQSWGGSAPAVTEKQLAQARRKLDPAIDSSTFQTPRIAALLDEPNADQLVMGMRLNAQTRDLLPDNVGNDMNCASCHLNAGTVAEGSPYTGVIAFFPAPQARAGREVTMEDRINGCFRRSMNGTALDETSEEMKAMVAYFDWMRNEHVAGDDVPGRGIGSVDTSLTPDPERGKEIYARQCAVCHGDDGEGIRDAAGQVIYPALWGDRSFNIGAGMARTYKAATFVKQNMPVALHDNFPLGQGGLSDQDAVDVAEYFTHMPRPDFPDKVHDWPDGNKPKDARY